MSDWSRLTIGGVVFSWRYEVPSFLTFVFQEDDLFIKREEIPVEPGEEDREYDPDELEIEEAGFRNRAWRYVITRSEAVPTSAEIDKWVDDMSSEVIRLWSEDRHLMNVVAQLNAESGLGLQQALVASSQGITRGLWRIALAIASLSTIGGGGIALLVLFIDKG